MDLISIGIIVISLAVALWLITSAKWRKQMGTAISKTTGVHAERMYESAEAGRVTDQLDFIQELADSGYTPDLVEQHRKDFDRIVLRKNIKEEA